MRIGFILECGPKGPDAIIYPYLAKRFCASIKIEQSDVLTLSNKVNVMNDAAYHAQLLLETGCERVVIIWDRMPKWGGSGNCDDHRRTVEKNMEALGLDPSKIILCCIKDMLESWMLGDGSAITAYFQGLTNHPITPFPDYKSAIEQSKPEEKLSRYNGRYNKFADNIKIILLIKDFDKIAKRNDSFDHFKKSIETLCK